jgi:uncharacterized protein YecE (DUF72 family)
VRVFAGTSGFAYAPWKGSFYPEKLPAAQMLGYYAGRLPAVEINNSFYRMPRREALAAWADETPAAFSFVLKAPQRITHQKRLLEVDDTVTLLADVSAGLGTKRGPVLFQLPPNLRKDLGRLEGFLATLATRAPGLRAAFEFRHASWFEADVLAALRNAGAALCIAESEDLETPFEATTTWGYLRLRREDYDEARLATWADRLQEAPLQRYWTEAFVFFKHEDAGVGPKLAARFLELTRPGSTGPPAAP